MGSRFPFPAYPTGWFRVAFAADIPAAGPDPPDGTAPSAGAAPGRRFARRRSTSSRPAPRSCGR